jgi:hypothetical protein
VSILVGKCARVCDRLVPSRLHFVHRLDISLPGG